MLRSARKNFPREGSGGILKGHVEKESDYCPALQWLVKGRCLIIREEGPTTWDLRDWSEDRTAEKE